MEAWLAVAREDGLLMPDLLNHVSKRFAVS
jgi:hypothetical protein